MTLMLAALSLISLALAAVMGTLLARSTNARVAAERELAVTRQRLADGENRLGDFERLRAESLQAAQAAVLATAQQLSSKLLEDHKRENAEAKKDAEERVRHASEHLVRQVDEIAKVVHKLHGQVEEKGAALDTLWRALSSPGGAGELAEIGLAKFIRKAKAYRTMNCLGRSSQVSRHTLTKPDQLSQLFGGCSGIMVGAGRFCAAKPRDSRSVNRISLCFEPADQLRGRGMKSFSSSFTMNAQEPRLGEPYKPFSAEVYRR